MEIGGWDPKFVLQNPPLSLLPEECNRAELAARVLALATPRLDLGKVRVEPLSEVDVDGRAAFRVALEVINDGYLGTNVTAQAQQAGAAKPIVAELRLPVGGKLVAGLQKQEVAGLDGFGGGRFGPALTDAWVEWVVLAQAGESLAVEVRHPRAGRVQRRFMLA